MSGRSRHSTANTAYHIDHIGGVNKFDKDPTLSAYSDYNIVSQKAIVDYVNGRVASKDEFKELSDTPGSYTMPNVIYTSNSVPDQVIESGTSLTNPGANNFKITRGTTSLDCQANLTVTGASTINQDVSTTGNPTFSTANISGKLTVGGLIDPTGLQLAPTSANPGDANTFWVDSVDSNKMKKGANTVVIGPTSSVDNTLPRFDSSGGNLLQTTNIAVDDSDNVSGIHNINADGDTFKFGNSTATTNALMHVQSKQQVDLFLEADTDNVVETENPRILFVQDGGIVASRIGYSGTNDLIFATSSSTGNVNAAMHFYCGGNTHTSNGTGNLPTNFVNHTRQLSIYGPVSGTRYVQVATYLRLASGAYANEFSIDGTLAGNSDNAIPTEKAVKTYVDNALHSTASGTISGDLFGPIPDTAYTISYKTHGDIVVLSFPGIAVNGNSTAALLKFSVLLSTPGLLPASSSEVNYYIRVLNGGTYKDGICNISATGLISIGLAPDMNVYTATTGLNGFADFYITYYK